MVTIRKHKRRIGKKKVTVKQHKRKIRGVRDSTGPYGRGLGPGKGVGCNDFAAYLYKEGESKNQPDSRFNKTQLRIGTEVELEHAPNRTIAKEIAKDHLCESPMYYVELIKMEKKLGRKKSKRGVY